MIKNSILSKGNKTKRKQIKNNEPLSAERELELKEYKSLVNNKKRLINLKILEEEKNLENSLSKITYKFNRIKASKLRNENQNFSNEYNSFSKKHFKTIDLLMKDLSDAYNNKGYQIPNLQSNLFKKNPLLENRTNKIYLLYLSTLNHKESNKKKLYNSNKPIKYMKKLENIISPDVDNKKNKMKTKANVASKRKIDKKLLKINVKEKKITERLNNSIKSLINLINTNMTNIDNQSYIKKRNNSEIVLKKNNQSKNNKIYNAGIFSDIKDLHIDSQKNLNDSYIKTTNSDKKTTISNYYINHENNLVYRNNYKSTKKLIIPKLNALFPLNSINKISKEDNDTLYLKTERGTNKTKQYILNTPRILKKPNLSNEKSNNKTKAFSITNENSSLSYRSRVENSKTKESPYYKINEFTINSYKSSTSNKFNQTTVKKSKYTYSNKINKVENLNGRIPLEFKISSPKKILKNDDDTKEKNINGIYKLFNNFNIKDSKKNIKLYLSKTKQLNENEINEMMSKYSYENNNLYLQELQKLINEKKISNKIFKLYLNNNDYNRIEPLLKALNEKDEKIMQFDKKIALLSNIS